MRTTANSVTVPTPITPVIRPIAPLDAPVPIAPTPLLVELAPPSANRVAVALARKLSHAAIVALGAAYVDAVVPEP